MRNRRGHNEKGFSLVEVVSSLGIISVGLIALLGLLPVGMKTSRVARESTVETQIAQYLSGFVRRTPSAALGDAISGREFCFDAQGLPVIANSDEVFYRVTLSLAAPESEPATPGEYLSANLSTVQMRVTRRNDTGTRTMALHRAVSSR